MNIRPAAIASFLALFLVACTPQAAQWSGAESSKEIKVEWVNFRHDVSFTTGQAAPSDFERARFQSFLAQMRMTPSSRVAVAAAEGPLAAPRAEAIRALLAEQRIESMSLARGSLDDLGPGSVAVIVGRYVATPPNCPDWRKPANQNFQNSPSSNFGCANAVNLALMVEDPADLLRGRPLGPGDAAGLVHGIQRYRSNLVIPPAGQVTQTSVEAATSVGSP